MHPPSGARAVKPDPAAAAELFCAALEAAGAPATVSDAVLRRVFAAVVKAYAARAEAAADEPAPFEPGTVTATETVVAACAMIRAADLNLFDLAMWFRRPLPDSAAEARR